MAWQPQGPALLAVALPVAAFAAGAQPAPEAPFASAGADTATYSSREYRPDGQLSNREHGRLRGLALSAGGWWGLSWIGRHHEGNVDYIGQSQSGIPIVSTTQLEIIDQRLAWQGRLPWPAAATLSAEAAIGQRRIERLILPTVFTSPLTERLRWTYLRAGLRAHLWPMDYVALEGALGFEHGLRGRLAVDYHGFGTSPALRPRATGGAWLGAGLTWRPHEALQAGARCDWQRQRYGASASQPFTFAGGSVGSVSYPGSWQTLRSCGVHLELRFTAAT